MENTPEAPATAPAVESVETPINSNPAPAQEMPDMHGFTSEQLADMKKFFDNNGGFDKIKARISNPEPKPVEQSTQSAQPQTQPQAQPVEPTYKRPEGAITREEFLAQQYFNSLAREQKYEAIAKEIESGAVLKDMAAFNIHPINQDGSINDTMVRRYLDLKAQTVTAKQTATTPEASAAPTVDYVPFEEGNMDMRKAMAVLQQDGQLKSRGLSGHPQAQAAEEFMKKTLNQNH